MSPETGLRVAFVAGLSDKKLRQKLEPLLVNPGVARVALFRRAPFPCGDRLRVFGVGRLGRRFLVLGEVLRFARLLWQARHCDVVVGCFQLYHGVMAHLAGWLWGKPVIQLVITDVDWNMDRPLARWAMLGADACGVRGPASAARLRCLGFAGPVAVVHNPAAPVPTPTRQPGLARIDVIAVGDIALEKDYPLLVAALGRVKARLGRLSAKLCGRGFPGTLAAPLEDQGLAGDVAFPGHLDHEALNAAYDDAKLLVLSSSVEGLPMVVVEAMARGLPVVATAVGEMAWLVRDGLDGRLVPPGDAQALAGAIADLLESPERRRAMGNNARERIRELAPEFSVPAIAAAWEELLTVARLPDGDKAAKSTRSIKNKSR